MYGCTLTSNLDVFEKLPGDIYRSVGVFRTGTRITGDDLTTALWVRLYNQYEGKTVYSKKHLLQAQGYAFIPPDDPPPPPPPPEEVHPVENTLKLSDGTVWQSTEWVRK